MAETADMAGHVDEPGGDPVADRIEGDETVRAGGVGPLIPRQIGQFHLKRLIASGGMGTVYLAVQENPRRTVALKVMKHGIASPSSLHRFEFESHILARLRHPNVAQVFEAGTHDSGEGGVPYFAMEYVPNARPIDAYVREKRLGTRETLEIFVKVCEAVHHGHQKGVIHRDLKPGNILVDSSGEPKIIDFGVARSTDSDMAVTTLQTEVGQLVGTLQYMSPEQCDADPHDLDTRSDVYALGVILYELLCRRLPYDVSSKAVFEAARMIKETSPARPSTIDRALRGDLETITLTAMEKDRVRRYQSANALVRDIRRFLAEEPIDARPPSLVYQVRMFARRNRAAFFATGAVAAVMVVATVVSIAFAIRARSAEQGARTAEREAIRQRDLAVTARAEMQVAKLESERQRDAALAAEARAQQQSYIVNVAAAAAALDAGGEETARRRLSHAPEQWRGWEWAYMRGLADQSLGTLRGHKSWVNAVSFSSDGSVVATAGADGTIRVFSDATGEEVASWTAHRSPIYALACSPRGRLLASGSADMTIRVWSMTGGEELALFRGHEGVVTALAYTTEGTRLVSGSSDMTVRMWDSTTGKELAIYRLDASADCVAVSGDGRLVACGADDATVRLWDATSGAERPALRGHEGYVNAIDFNPAGDRLVTASEDGTVRVWNVQTGLEVLQLRGHAGYVRSVAFDSSGTRIASGAEDSTVRLWDAGTGAERAVLHGHDGYLTSLAFSPDGFELATGSEDGTVKLWDTSALEWLQRGATDGRSASAGIRTAVFSPGGGILASGGDDSSLVLWSLVTGARLATLSGEGGVVRTAAFSPDGRLLASGSDDGSVQLWNAATGAALARLRGHEQLVTSIVFDADSRRLVSGSWDGTIRIWSCDTGTQDGRIQCIGSINTVALEPGSGRIAGGASDGSIIVIDKAATSVSATWSGHEGPLHAVAFSPDGARFASGSADGTIRMWDTSIGQTQAVLRGHDSAVTSVCFTPDGSRLLSGSSDGSVRVWDVRTAELIAVLPDRAVSVDCLAMSGDGLRLVSGSRDGSLRVRDARSSRDRLQRRTDARFATSTARALVDGLLGEGLKPAEIAERLRGDASLSEPVRLVAGEHLLQRSVERAAGGGG